MFSAMYGKYMDAEVLCFKQVFSGGGAVCAFCNALEKHSEWYVSPCCVARGTGFIVAGVIHLALH